MKNIYCTLFNINFLLRGLALYKSLLSHANNFCLWILCMDDETYKVLKKLNLPKAKLIKLSEFENSQLKKIKNGRTVAEYCWTCTPFLIDYVLKKSRAEIVSYLDADLYFYSSPEPIFKEIGNASIMIIPHRFYSKYKDLEKFGKYNVSMISFRNDVAGRKCLNWWKKQCAKWCFARIEGEKMGDQGYLNHWPEKFSGVHVLNHIGANLAAWNLENYRLSLKNGKIYVNNFPLIFYHFQEIELYSDGFFRANDYPLTDFSRKKIYKPYAEFISKLDFSYRLPQKPSLLDPVIGKIVKSSKIFQKFAGKRYGMKTELVDVGLDNEKNRREWLERILKTIPENKVVLDAGAGECQYRGLCGHLKYISQDLGKYHGKKTDIKSDVTQIPLKSNSVDVILCTEVLEHVSEPIKAILEFSRLLKKGGKLIITAPFCSLTHYEPEFFYTGFSPYFYKKFLPKFGFKILELEPNGNYFSYLGQEIQRLEGISGEYLKQSLSSADLDTREDLLQILKKLAEKDESTSELLAYGYFVFAEKK